MSMGNSERERLLRESQHLANSLLERLRKQAASALFEDPVAAKSPNAPKSKPSKATGDREKPVKTTKATAAPHDLASDLYSLAKEQLAKRSTTGPLSAGLALEDEDGVKYTIDHLPTIEQMEAQKGKGDEQIAVYVQPNAAPSVEQGSRPGDRVPIQPKTLEQIKNKKIGIA